VLGRARSKRRGFAKERAIPRWIYRALAAADWEAAQAAGRYEGAAHDRADGFLHFSAADQVAETLAKHYAGRADLVLLAVDGARLGDALKWEVSRGGALFPHLYASLAVSAVSDVFPLKLNGDGRHILPDDLA